LLVDDVEKPLVQPELVPRQINFRKQQAFGKKVIRYRDVLKKVFLLNQFFNCL
jgi:hypothetical protein